jgi:hypothetical protein
MKEASMSIKDDPSGPKKSSGPDDVREDQEFLAAKRVGSGWSVGWQPELHGPLGQSVDGYRATVFELQQMARYWYREWWGIRLWEIYSQQTGSYEIRMRPYAGRRLDRICEAIGEKAFREVTDEVDAETRKQIGEEDWAAINGDDKAAKERLLKRIEAELDRLKNEPDPSNGSGGPAPSELPSEGQAE